MAFVPHPQEIYRHFKGNLYQIITLAEHSETGETLVIYQALYGDYKVYARPLSLFAERLDPVRYPEAGQEFRFALQKGLAAENRSEAAPVKAGETTGTGKVEVPQKPEKIQEAKEAEKIEEAVGFQEEEQELDPMLLEFLDADTYEQRLKILTALHHRVTHEMLTTMAVACDIEVSEGDLEERYESLRRCLLTLERYECNRLR